MTIDRMHIAYLSLGECVPIYDAALKNDDELGLSIHGPLKLDDYLTGCVSCLIAVSMHADVLD